MRSGGLHHVAPEPYFPKNQSQHTARKNENTPTDGGISGRGTWIRTRAFCSRDRRPATRRSRSINGRNSNMPNNIHQE